MPEGNTEHTNPTEVLGEGFWFEQTKKHAEELEIANETRSRELFAGDVKDWIAAAGGGALQSFPLTPQTVEYQLYLSPLNQWGYRTVETGPMYSREQVIAMLEAELRAPLGEKLSADQLKAAGLPAYTPTTVDMSATFGFDYQNGYIAFKGNWQQFPPHGTEAVNPADSQVYVFWRRGNAYSTGALLSGYWVAPPIFDQKENQRW